MNAKMILDGFLLVSLFCATGLPARAQAGSPQQTLNQYVAELQSNPNDAALRGKIIALAQSMRPAPAIPEEARGHYVMATTFAEKAKSDTERAKNDSDLKLANAGFVRAVAEYKAALLAAPWWADAYKKLAVTQKAAEQYDDAIASLNLYLLTQPADARDAQDEVYKLKALKQSAADDQRMAAQKAIDDQQAQQRTHEASPEGQFEALLRKIDGRRYFNHEGASFDVRGRNLVFGSILRGTYHVWFSRPIEGYVSTEHKLPAGMASQTTTISEDGSRITVHTRYLDDGQWLENDNVFLWQQ
jgi:tetratricopeptide (TPR) repeat protein